MFVTGKTACRRVRQVASQQCDITELPKGSRLSMQGTLAVTSVLEGKPTADASTATDMGAPRPLTISAVVPRTEQKTTFSLTASELEAEYGEQGPPRVGAQPGHQRSEHPDEGRGRSAQSRRLNNGMLRYRGPTRVTRRCNPSPARWNGLSTSRARCAQRPAPGQLEEPGAVSPPTPPRTVPTHCPGRRRIRPGTGDARGGGPGIRTCGRRGRGTRVTSNPLIGELLGLNIYNRPRATTGRSTGPTRTADTASPRSPTGCVCG